MKASTRVAILTPDPADRDFHSRWRSVFERTAAPFRAHGLTVETRSWAEAGNLSEFDLILPLLVWGYHRAGPAWHEATTVWENEGLNVRNVPSVLRWNSNKLYLRRLADRGAPVVRTLFVDRIDDAILNTAVDSFESEQLIAKPQISASAWQTIRWSPGRSLEGGPTGSAMLQPFLPSIESEGEISLIYVDGVFSHAIRKRPQPGDFRVQPEYDGVITPHEPAADEIEASERILAEVDEKLLYARVDLVRDLDGAPRLMELELVEPDLYLEHDPDGGAGFVEAVASAAAVTAAI
jgi:glutathione synthase/RimK-type ligase-like ATP-grasp enzyme